MWLIHSAKGSTWKSPMYVKREGTPGKMEETGKYYYPDDYKGGRHLPKNGKKDNRVKQNTSKHKYDYPDDMEEWEKKVHDHIDGIVKAHPEMFKTGTDVAKGILDDKNLNAVKNTLKAFGVPVDKLSDDDIKKYRKKIADAYDDAYTPNKTEEKKTSSKKSKKSDDKKEDNKKEDDKKETKKNTKKTEKKSTGKEVDKKVYTGGIIKHRMQIVQNDYLEHHGILGMKWGKRNGPPYPLTGSSHSAAESVKKKAKKIGKHIVRSSGSRSSKTLADARQQNINELTTEQLNSYNKRLQAEKQFADLTKGNVNEGMRFVIGIGKNVISSITTGILIGAGMSFVKSKIKTGG